jgi:large subunit ribosomal protein L6
MSRIARKPVTIPKGVEFKLTDFQKHVKGEIITARQVLVKGKKGEMTFELDAAVNVQVNGDQLTVKSANDAHPMVGTTCKLLSNMMHGVSEGFERKLLLVGVGYRAKMQGKDLELSLGFSHPVIIKAPNGITIDVPTNTEIVIKGMDKQVVGQTAAEIRSVRSPEHYKGKGVRYADEVVVLKETKKK